MDVWSAVKWGGYRCVECGRKGRNLKQARCGRAHRGRIEGDVKHPMQELWVPKDKAGIGVPARPQGPRGEALGREGEEGITRLVSRCTGAVASDGVPPRPNLEGQGLVKEGVSDTGKRKRGGCTQGKGKKHKGDLRLGVGPTLNQLWGSCADRVESPKGGLMAPTDKGDALLEEDS